MERESTLERLEIRLLLDGIYHHYGYDFRDYVHDYILRRVRQQMEKEKVGTISEFQSRLLHSADSFFEFLWSLSTQVTSMFRDPEFYRVFREYAIPILKTMPFFRIWHAGCSTGEEVYSMAILLTEEGIYDQCRIYATDFSEEVLEKAQGGVFPLRGMQENTAGYQQSGGKREFSEFYTAKYDSAVFQADLKKNIIFAEHNLVTDGSFNEFQVIFCRNVMIYFSPSLQLRVLNLLYESLRVDGFLGLGSGENIQFTNQESCFDSLQSNIKLYRKIK